MSSAIEIKRLFISFDGFGLQIRNLSIPKGYVTGLIGQNGAGKTTLIRSILNLHREAIQEITILGKMMEKEGITIKDQIGFVGENFLFPSHYSAKEIGKKLGVLYSRYEEALYDDLLRRLDVNPRKSAQVCSEGTKAKMSLAFALATQPQLLILDEPMAHLDPVARRKVLDLLYEYMQQENHTILFSTHITEDLDRIADYILFLKEGKVIFMHSKEELIENYQFIRIPRKKACKELLSSIRNRSKQAWKEGMVEGMCTQSRRFLDVEEASFQQMSIEEIMINLNQESQKD